MATPTLSNEVIERLKPAVFTQRIIILALVIGVVTYMGVTLFMHNGANVAGGNAPAGANPAGGDVMDHLMTVIAFLAAMGAVIVSRILPLLMTAAARKQIAAGTFPPPKTGSATPPSPLTELGDVGRLTSTYMTNSIISAALLEGAAFLNIVVFSLEGIWVSLGIAAGLVLLILVQFPSTSRVVNWIERQLRLIDEEKLLARQ